MPTEAPDWVVAHEERQKWVNRLYYGDNLDVLLAQPLPHIPDWKLTARRLAAIHFDGLAGAAATAFEQ
jgi:hypothetical protein